FTEGGSAAGLFSGTDINTVEAGQTISGLSFTVSNVTDGGNEIINLDGTDIVLTNGTSGTTASNSLGYSVSVSDGTVTVSLTGGTLSTAAAQTLVDSMSYQNNSNTPSTSNRVVTLTSLQDSGGTANGGDDSASLDIVSTVAVMSVNDAPSFFIPGGAGIVGTAIGDGMARGYSVVAQDDGKILVAGYSWNGSDDDITLVRYNSDGGLDVTFGNNGIVTTGISIPEGSNTLDGLEAGDDRGYAVTVQADGKILVAGQTNDSVSNKDVAVVRFNADGILDSGFGNGGTATIALDGMAGEYAWSVIEQSDGKIVMAVTGTNVVTVVRLTDTGALDGSFAGSGIVTTDVAGGTENVTRVAQQSDGKIVVAGIITSPIDTFPHTSSEFLVLRYLDDGSLDTGFGGGDGMATIGAGYTIWGTGLDLQADGKMVVGGMHTTLTLDPVTQTTAITVVRLNSDGTADTGFGSDGVAADSSLGWSQFKDIAVQADGSILVAGNKSVSGNGADYALMRFTASGALDTGFAGGAGSITTDIGNANNYAWDMALDPDGKILLAGNRYVGEDNDFAVARYNSDGTLDTSFGSNTLSGTVNFTEGGMPVVLDSDVQIFDAELDAGNYAGNYAGATLTLQRQGGADVRDQFSATGTLDALVEGDELSVDSTVIGTVTTSSGGTLVLTFNGSATQALVIAAMRQIAYANSADNPPASVQIDWLFSDNNTGAQGSGGALTATGAVTVAITGINDAPTLTATGSNPTFTEDGAVASLFSGTSIDVVEAGQTISGLSFTVSNVTDGSNEIINIDGTDIVLTDGTNGTTASSSLGYSVSVSDGTATVSLTGGTLSTAAAQTLIDSMSYQNNSQDPDTSNHRVVTLTSLQDSGGTANGGDDVVVLAVASTVTLVAVNDAPVFSGGTDTSGPAPSDETASTVEVTEGPAETPLSLTEGQTVSIGFYAPSTVSSGTWQTARDFYDAEPGMSTVVYDYANRLDSYDLSVDLLFVMQPDNAFNAEETVALSVFLAKGGRIFFIGEHNGYKPAQNGNISSVITALGGSITVLGGAYDDALHDNNSDNWNLNNSPLLAGVTAFRTAYYAQLQIDPNISQAVVVDDSNRIVLADQALSMGRVTVLADQNWLNSHYLIEGNQTFLRNLAIDTVQAIELVADGGNPNAGFTSSTGLTETDAGLADAGTLMLTDVDTADEVTVSHSVAAVQKDAAGDQMATSVAVPSTEQLRAMLSLSPTPVLDSSTTTGTLNWTFDSGNEAFNFLKQGEQLVLTYTLTADDGNGGTATQDIAITINGTNDAPVAESDTVIAIEAGGVANGSAGSNASGNVLSNDSDVDDGDTKTVTGVVLGDTSGTVGAALAGQYGSLTLHEDGSYSYVIDENNAAVQALRTSGQTLTETFSYTVTDAGELSDSATLTITLQGQNDNPVAANDTATAVEAG
ncbi:beta strand repeat-containing protein, partial [Oceanisphaera psychrotolerans]|uniref:beta strand repeat-containing protein n=1 Tax=Oceanisphaera psychrotolerans TaxID=1414654 RepID=UPI000AA1A7D6